MPSNDPTADSYEFFGRFTVGFFGIFVGFMTFFCLCILIDRGLQRDGTPLSVIQIVGLAVLGCGLFIGGTYLTASTDKDAGPVIAVMLIMSTGPAVYAIIVNRLARHFRESDAPILRAILLAISVFLLVKSGMIINQHIQGVGINARFNDSYYLLCVTLPAGLSLPIVSFWPKRVSQEPVILQLALADGEQQPALAKDGQKGRRFQFQPKRYAR
jgi:hypothetical protein